MIDTLLDALGTLDRIATGIEHIVLSAVPGRKRELVQLRRELGMALETIGQRLREDVDSTRAPATLQQAATRLSEVRHVVALHQRVGQPC